MLALLFLSLVTYRRLNTALATSFGTLFYLSKSQHRYYSMETQKFYFLSKKRSKLNFYLYFVSVGKEITLASSISVIQ